jgi:hypothetical protein
VRFLAGILILFASVTVASGQKDTIRAVRDSLGNIQILQNVERNGEILPEVQIKAVTVVPQGNFVKKKDFRRYERLVYNVKRVYPYAMLVRLRLYQVNQELMDYSTEKERKDYLKKVEKDVFKQYEGDIRELTITQGRILIKLIDRETQNTSYTLIKDYRGKFAAAFWQGIARIFGTNLKERYDPLGEDALIEAIILEIDAGNL